MPGVPGRVIFLLGKRSLRKLQSERLRGWPMRLESVFSDQYPRGEMVRIRLGLVTIQWQKECRVLWMGSGSTLSRGRRKSMLTLNHPRRV